MLIDTKNSETVEMSASVTDDNDKEKNGNLLILN